MIKVGVVGCGTIGKELAQVCQKQFAEFVTLKAICDFDDAHAKKLLKELKSPKPSVMSLDKLIDSCDLIVEAASAASAYEISKKALKEGKDVMVMSVGGILGREKEINKLAQQHRCCLYLPSGGVVGIDGLKAAHIGKIHRVTLTTRKPPQSYEDAPYIIKNKINLKTLKQEKLLFAGNAIAAVKAFPKNINVSATISLAGIGAKRTQVRIIAAPQMLVNVHELYAVGEFGTFYTRTENFPSANNPRTSHLAVLSAIATLERILKNIKIGT